MLALLVAFVAPGCNEESSSTAADTSGSGSGSASTPRPHNHTFTVPTGTEVVATLVTPLTTETNHTGDSFVATTNDAIVVDGKTIVASGSQIRGVLQNVQASGKVKGRATMTLAFQQIVDSKGQSHSISAEPLTLRAASDKGDDIEKVAAGGIAGAIIGGITGGKKGALIGTAIGAGAGTIVVLVTE
jgi:hypothetical protein